MSKLWKLIVATLIAVFAVASLALAAPQAFGVQDGIMNAAAKTKVSNEVYRVANKNKANVCIHVFKNMGNVSAEQYARSQRDKNALGDKVNGGIILVLDMTKKQFYIATDPKMAKIVTDGYGIPTLKNGITAKMKAGDLAGACTTFTSYVDQMMAYYQKNGKPMGGTQAATSNVVAKNNAAVPAGKQEKGIVDYLLVALSGICGGIGYRGYLRGQMGNVFQASEAAAYVVGDGLELTGRDDVYDHTEVTRTHRSSGGSSGGGGGGGSSSGGGGGGSW